MAKKSKTQERAEEWLNEFCSTLKKQKNFTKYRRLAIADLLYEQYSEGLTGHELKYPFDFYLGLDEQLACRFVADEIYRDIGLEPLTDRQIMERWPDPDKS